MPDKSKPDRVKPKAGQVETIAQIRRGQRTPILLTVLHGLPIKRETWTANDWRRYAEFLEAHIWALRKELGRSKRERANLRAKLSRRSKKRISVKVSVSAP